MTATTAPASRDRFEEADTADLDGLLAHRRWQRRARPFPHVVADSVFTPTFAHRLAEDFGRVFEGAGYDTNHDFVGTSLIRGRCGALDVFLSPGWLALAAGLFDVPGPCYLTGGIHRHRPGSRDGFPHNDIHPERLRRTTTPGELLTGSGSDRADGTAAGRSGTDAMPQGLAVRAVAMLYVNEMATQARLWLVMSQPSRSSRPWVMSTVYQSPFPPPCCRVRFATRPMLARNSSVSVPRDRITMSSTGPSPRISSGLSTVSPSSYRPRRTRIRSPAAAARIAARTVVKSPLP